MSAHETFNFRRLSGIESRTSHWQLRDCVDPSNLSEARAPKAPAASAKTGKIAADKPAPAGPAKAPAKRGAKPKVPRPEPADDEYRHPVLGTHWPPMGGRPDTVAPASPTRSSVNPGYAGAVRPSRVLALRGHNTIAPEPAPPPSQSSNGPEHERLHDIGDRHEFRAKLNAGVDHEIALKYAQLAHFTFHQAAQHAAAVGDTDAAEKYAARATKVKDLHTRLSANGHVAPSSGEKPSSFKTRVPTGDEPSSLRPRYPSAPAAPAVPKDMRKTPLEGSVNKPRYTVPMKPEPAPRPTLRGLQDPSRTMPSSPPSMRPSVPPASGKTRISLKPGRSVDDLRASGLSHVDPFAAKKNSEPAHARRAETFDPHAKADLASFRAGLVSRRANERDHGSDNAAAAEHERAARFHAAAMYRHAALGNKDQALDHFNQMMGHHMNRSFLAKRQARADEPVSSRDENPRARTGRSAVGSAKQSPGLYRQF